MNKETKRVYVDNSVVSGMFDDHMPERVEHMRQFWQAVIDGKIRIIASDVMRIELDNAPMHVQDFFGDLPESQIEHVKSTDESDDLATQYISTKVISENHKNDCKHIAIATIANADAVVSWNCEDMVNPNRIPKYNEVNTKHGYQEIKIQTPKEFMEVHYGNT
jgi:predicted nucleic acid-binding protein